MRAQLLALALIAAAPAAAQTVYPAAAQGNVRLFVPVRNIARGEIISASDLTPANLPAARAAGGVALNPGDLQGKEARRFLSAGEPVRISDVRNPILVTRGQTVTMTFSVPGITVTAVGKAMGEGGIGDSITVVNPISFRQIGAIVTGPGAVMAAGSEQSAPARIAAALQ